MSEHIFLYSLLINDMIFYHSIYLESFIDFQIIISRIIIYFLGEISDTLFRLFILFISNSELNSLSPLLFISQIMLPHIYTKY